MERLPPCLLQRKYCNTQFLLPLLNFIGIQEMEKKLCKHFEGSTD